MSEKRMSSSGRPRRSKYRFGFRGKRPSRGPQQATTDEILDSLTQQAKLMERDGEERTIGLRTILEAQPLEVRPQSLNSEPGRTSERSKTRSLGKSAFALMLLVGLAFLWIYSRLPEILIVQSLTTLQQTISRAGFANSQKIVLIALPAVIIALLAHRSRNMARSRLSLNS